MPTTDPVERPLLLRALARRQAERPPIWLMRQAGRYLPEYRRLRERAGTFLELCLTPELAAEATLQPVRRFALDAAILFSDILVVAHGLGQELRFDEGHGPRLEPVVGPTGLGRLRPEMVRGRLAPVYEAVRQVRAALPPEVALIGFAGAPWTVASYMVEGSTSRDHATVKAWAFADPDGFGRLIALLSEVTIDHLVAQARAGAQALQLFDSWIGALPAEGIERWGLEPARRIVAAVREAAPGVPVILFPRGAGVLYTHYAERSGADALSLDAGIPLGWAARRLQPHCVLQGNLDPVLLAVGGEPMRRAAREILERLGAGGLVFNLGHGVLPHTPPGHVNELCSLVRGWRH
ncbi:MAG: uroporphyrinogen decarboxylase [Rhodospirillaceae bacterium]|nr:uroporphyrinogen decarboxylase [Rhodospirillaceae bacterium]